MTAKNDAPVSSISAPPNQSMKWAAGLAWLGGLLWLVHGLEKVLFMVFPGLALPAPLHGGTGDLINILLVFARDNPLVWFRALVETFMLPFGAVIQWQATLMELGFGVALVAGPALWNRRRWILPAVLVLIFGQLAFINLGFYYFEWPFTYALIAGAHLAVWARWQAGRGEAATVRWVDPLLRMLLGAVWLYEAATAAGPFLAFVMALVGVLLLIGWRTPSIALAGLVLAVHAHLTGGWGAWWWVYYFAYANHLYVAALGGGQHFGLSAWLAARRPDPAAGEGANAGP
ncbi:MAG: hypothetical protein WD535_01085 [Thermaerobacterales bacterium]